VRQTFDRIENFRDPAYDEEMSRYVSIERPLPSDKGPVSVEYAVRWEDFMPGVMRGVEEFGFKLNRDLNDGDPIGVGFSPASAREGVRVTARTAYLCGGVGNREVREALQVKRVVFDGKRAVGVESMSGERSEFWLTYLCVGGVELTCCSFCEEGSYSFGWCAGYS
jgi:choline dehydrogenase-like flavoprotein